MGSQTSEDKESEASPTHLAIRKIRSRAAVIAGGFAVSMMLLSLILPFAYARKEMAFWPSMLQVFLWTCFSASWIYLGYLTERTGTNLFSPREPSGKPDPKAKRLQVTLFLFAFVPSCFLYVYVTYANTGYLGFNYVCFFVLAGFATQVFRIRTFVVYLMFQIFGWAVLCKLMWGSWQRFDDLVTAASGYLFSSMMFILLRRERESRFQVEALSHELDQANEQLRSYSSQVEELAATQERNRIAREIHDTLGHCLTVVNVQLETARALIGGEPEKADAFLQKAQSLTKKGLGDIRDSVASLRSSPLDGKGFEPALHGLLDTIASSGVSAEFRVLGEARPVDAQSALALYRSAQEGLTNVRKHANAKRVVLTIDYRDERKVTVSLADDGIGCADTSGGFGMMGIRERMQLLNGESVVKTSPGKGLELVLGVPA